MQRILITGGTGYIGSCFIKHVLSAHATCKVYMLARAPFNMAYLSEVQDKVRWYEYDGSIQSVKVALESSQPDLVYHLATFFTKDHGDTELPSLLQANIELGCNLVEAMSQKGVKNLIYTTSVTEYGADGSYQPATLYAAMKRAFLDIAQFYVQQGAIKLGVLMLTDTYGPNDQRSKVMNILKQAVEQGREMCFSSSGEQIFDLVYIDDVVEALYLLGLHVQKEGGESLQCYQVFAEQPLSLKDTVEVFTTVNHLDCKVSWAEQGTPQDKQAQQSKQDPTVVRLYPCVPGFKEQVSLQDGMRRFFQG